MTDTLCHECSCGVAWKTQTEADWCQDECDQADRDARRR